MKNFGLAALAIAICSVPLASVQAQSPTEGFHDHLVISLGVGIGSLSPTQYNSYVDTFNGQAASAGSPLQGDPAHVGFELHVPIVATYYFSYFLLLRTGVEAAYFFPGETLSNESATNYGGILEVPIFIGGHYSFLNDRLVAEIGLGPAIAAYTSAGLSGSASNGFTGTQLYGSPSVGFDDELKGQYFITPSFSLGLELGYRVLMSSQLHDSNGVPAMSNNQPVQLDMSGFRAVLEFGFTVF